MEIPIAVPVGETTGYKNAEEYILEQKQEALVCAEQELKKAIDAAEDFFDTKEDMDAMIRDILLHPEVVYTKPFMKKIASAVLRVTACKQDLEWASESVVDTSLTPAQVKAQVKQLLETQRVTWEQKMSAMEQKMSAMEQQMNADRAEWMKQMHKQMHDLQEELKEEREHRKAFQAKVKDFSEEVYLVMFYNMGYFKDEEIIRCGVEAAFGKIQKLVGVSTGEPIYSDPRSFRNNIIYKRAGITEKDYPRIQDGKQGIYEKQKAAADKFNFTTFDGTE